ncbi:unnamed protein product [Amoebophrya sp. A25]|nr:unnamed protein product [Amoebophrya sp. A25]|eukprot:GSA25T00025744001.1
MYATNTKESNVSAKEIIDEEQDRINIIEGDVEQGYGAAETGDAETTKKVFLFSADKADAGLQAPPPEQGMSTGCMVCLIVCVVVPLVILFLGCICFYWLCQHVQSTMDIAKPAAESGAASSAFLQEVDHASTPSTSSGSALLEALDQEKRIEKKKTA